MNTGLSPLEQVISQCSFYKDDQVVIATENPHDLATRGFWYNAETRIAELKQAAMAVVQKPARTRGSNFKQWASFPG
jgi:hypothetical protein